MAQGSIWKAPTMKPIWIVERGVYDDGNPERLKTILHSKNIPFIEVMFSETSEHYHGLWNVKFQKKVELSPGQCAVCYGSFTMARWILRNTAIIPGAWLDADAITCRSYYSHWGAYLLQQEYAFLPFSEVNRRIDWVFDHFGSAGKNPLKDRIFVRPDNNFKTFPGEVVTREGWPVFLKQARIDTPPDMMCVVAKPSNLRHEWRLVVSKGKVVTGSRYRAHGEVIISPHLPPEVVAFAEKVMASSDYHPHPVYCMDVAEVAPDQFGNGGGLFVVEIGSVNTCGLYDVI
jgi:hypothetical protein